jgi:hypothetical protein
MFYEQKFLFSLLLTLIIEIPIVFFLIKFLYKYKEIRTLKLVFTGLVTSTLTLPYFWFVLPFYISNRNLYIFFGEGLIILIEAIIYNQFLQLKFSRSFIISLFTNLSSIFLGLLIL